MAKEPTPDVTGSTVDVRITGAAHLGQGIGRVDGRVFMVPLTAVGDLVRAGVTADHRNWVQAFPLEIIEQGPGRVEPFCPVYGRCGGCHLQHLSDETREQWKRAVFEDVMRRIGGTAFPDVEFIGSEPANWRCRVSMHYDGTARDTGFFERASHRLVPPGRCPIAMEPVAALLEPIRERIRNSGPPGAATIEVVTGADDRCIVVINPESGRAAPLHEAVAGLDGISGVLSRERDSQWTVTGDSTILWPTAGLSGQIEHVPVDPRGFTQAHMKKNAALVEKVLEHAGDDLDGKTVLELYAGAGNITLGLAMRGARVFATDINTRAVDAAHAVLREKGLAVATDAGQTPQVLRRLPAGFRQPDMIIADPPRTGMGHDATDIAAIRAQRLVICSCEPSALARDLRVFVAAGWKVERATIVDMFPSTYHMEAVISLTFQR